MARTVHELEQDVYYFTYGPHPPVARISPGDSVRAKTVDALGWDDEGNPLPAEKMQSDGSVELLDRQSASRTCVRRRCGAWRHARRQESTPFSQRAAGLGRASSPDSEFWESRAK